MELEIRQVWAWVGVEHMEKKATFLADSLTALRCRLSTGQKTVKLKESVSKFE